MIINIIIINWVHGLVKTIHIGDFTSSDKVGFELYFVFGKIL